MNTVFFFSFCGINRHSPSRHTGGGGHQGVDEEVSRFFVRFGHIVNAICSHNLCWVFFFFGITLNYLFLLIQFRYTVQILLYCKVLSPCYFVEFLREIFKTLQNYTSGIFRVLKII